MKKREIIVRDGMGYVTLTKGFTAIIDVKDIKHAINKNWYAKVAGNTVYAKTTAYINGKRADLSLHREIMSAPEGLEVDHKNGDGLDNRRSNLRLVTHQQNMHNMRINKNNKSGHKGIFFCNRENKWIAKIKVNSKTINLGYFSNIDDAITVRINAVSKYHGEFGRIL